MASLMLSQPETESDMPVELKTQFIPPSRYYDIVVGEGAEAAVGARVAVHYDVKYRNVTFITSR